MTNPDLVLFQTQRLTDNANGGGQLTSTIIPDNQANNLFGPISRINRADGNVSLRKAIVKALSADTKTYFGAHIIVAAPPTNPDVTSLMFNTDSWTDVRSDAVEFVESYLVQGPQTRLWPYGNQVAGQRSIIAYQPISDALPSIGDTYVITTNNTPPTANTSQFVRIVSLTNTITEFSDTVGTFQLNVITMGISEPLTDAYTGAQAQRYSTPVPPSLMCTTNAANAATYYGVQTLSADASIGDDSASLTSVFGQLVPSTQGETAITSASPLGATAIVATGNAPVNVTVGTVHAPLTFYTGFAIVPGSLVVNVRDTPVHILDNGDGTLSSTSGSGTVDYGSGQVVIAAAIDAITTATANPAVSVQQSGYSTQQSVTEATRGYLYIQTLNPIPVPGSLIVSFRSLGRWFDLKDDGSGTLVGPVGAGTGTIHFDTGVATVTLGALPDLNSSVVFAWGQSTQYDIRTGDVNIQLPHMFFTTTQPIKPGTLSLTYVVSGVTKTVTDDAAGNLTGNGTGTISYGAGTISLKPTALPDPAVGIAVAYTTNPATNDSFTPTKSGANISITLSSHPVAPKSVCITYDVVVPASFPSSIATDNGVFPVVLVDDGSGDLASNAGPTVGTINYTTGVVTWAPDIAAITGQVPTYAPYTYRQWNASTNTYDEVTVQILESWQTTTVTAAFVNGSVVLATSTAASASSVSQTDNFPTPKISIDLTPKTVEAIVPGSIVLAYAGDTYIDRGGLLYRALNHLTNSGTSAGTIDYVTGLASISDWNIGGSQTISVEALLCQLGATPVGVLVSRVPGKSVRPSSFQIQANRASDSGLITATADADGNWTTSDMTGHIDVDSGFYTVRFGQLVLDSSLTSDQKAEPWYNSSAVDGTGHIWFPDEAISGSIRYSCVVETVLPLDAGVLGLDPVRLPSDGRVQIISGGNTLVFRNPLTYTFTGTKVAGDTISLPRGGLESVVLYDSDGVQVDISLYTSDLTAGSVTIANPADLSPYTQPFIATHTRGEMVLCTDAEITGQISFSPALVNDYPHASSYVSSALIADNSGNLQADYDTKFQQTTWNIAPATLWKDVVQGSSPTAVYDDIDWPIQVLDRDTITQRVALIFTSSTAGNIAFEELGIIGTFTTSADVAPVNPATGNPYFVLDHRGFGTGWAANNAIRFNLRGAGFPVWFIRSVQVGAAATLDDSFTTEIRWDE